MQMGVDLEVTIFFDYRTTAALSAQVDQLVVRACRGETELTGFAFMRTVRPDRTAIPLFLGAVAIGSFSVHYMLVSNTTWVKKFLEGKGATTAMLDSSTAVAAAQPLVARQ